ncbi:phage tail tape measure protein [Denitromonas sp.]|uniref:phage tail tape measure protein n=1 Tax=Denitromonas sp. TaxID=2734609 RepID=UPI003A83FC34
MGARDLRLEVILSAIDKATGPMKAIAGSSSKMAGVLKEARNELGDLKRAVGKMDEFRRGADALQANARATEDARTKLRELQAQIIAAEHPHRELTEAYKAQRREVRNLERAGVRMSGNQAELTRQFQAAGVPVNQLAARQAQLRQRMEQVNRVISEQGTRLARLKAAQAEYHRAMAMRNQLASSGVGAIGAGAAVGAPVLASVREFATAEDAATQLKVAMMGAGGAVSAEFKQINDLAMRLGNRLPGTSADYQNMMTMLIRQGMSAKSILGGLGEATAYLGVQLKMPMDAAAEFTAKLQDATRTSEAEMMGLVDVIQRAFYAGVDSDNMLNAFTKLSPALSILRKEGLGAAQALAPLVVMADQAGMKGEAAGNAYRKVFQGALNVDKIQKAIGKSGLKLKLDFTDGKGEFGGIDQLFAQLKKLKSLTAVERTGLLREIFGDDAETLQVLSLMIDKGREAYGEAQGKLAAQADLQRRVTEQLGTLGALWDAASGTFTNFTVAMGESIAPEVKAITTWLGEAAEGATTWAKENPRLAGTLMKIAAVLAVVLVGVGALMVAFAAVLGPLAIAKLAIATLGISFGALAMPAMVVIGVISAIAAAAYLIYTYWEPIKAFFSGVWNEIKAAFSGGLLGIAGLILNWSPVGLFYKAFAGVMGYFGIELPGKFTEFGGMLLDGLVNGITGALGRAKDAVMGVGDSVIGWFKEKLDIHSPSRVFAELGGYTMEGLALGLEGGASGPLKTLAKTARSLVAAAGVGLAGMGVAVAGGAGVNIDSRPPLAAVAAAGAAGGNHYEIHIHAAPGMDTQALARAVAEELDRRDREAAARRRSRLADDE